MVASSANNVPHIHIFGVLVAVGFCCLIAEVEIMLHASFYDC